MAWLAIAVRKSMSLEKEQSKVSQITINISTISNALGVEKPIFYNLHTINIRFTIRMEEEINRKGEKHEGPSRQRNLCGG